MLHVSPNFHLRDPRKAGKKKKGKRERERARGFRGTRQTQTTPIEHASLDFGRISAANQHPPATSPRILDFTDRERERERESLTHTKETARTNSIVLSGKRHLLEGFCGKYNLPWRKTTRTGSAVFLLPTFYFSQRKLHGRGLRVVCLVCFLLNHLFIPIL